MPSFATLSILASLCFSFTSAVPVAAPAAAAVAVVPRADVMSAPAILTQLMSNLTPANKQLSGMNKEDATPAAVAPVVGQITTALKNAINQAQALKGQPSDVVMAGGAPGEVVPLQNVAKLVADVLLLLIPTLVGLLQITGPTGDLVPILGPVGPLLTSLLTTLIPVVIGLVAALIPLVSGLLASVSGLVTALGLGGLIVALGL